MTISSFETQVGVVSEDAEGNWYASPLIKPVTLPVTTPTIAMALAEFFETMNRPGYSVDFSRKLKPVHSFGSGPASIAVTSTPNPE